MTSRRALGLAAALAVGIAEAAIPARPEAPTQLAAPRAAGVPLDLAAEALAAEDARAASPAFVKKLDDPSPAVRARVALTLGRIGEASLVAPVIARLKREPDAHARGTMCFALGLAARPEATKILVQSLGLDPSPAVRVRAAQALGFVRSPLSVPALLAALPPVGQKIDCSADELVWQLVVALFRHKDERATSPLAARALAASAGGCAELSRAATWGLARLKAPRAEAALHTLAAAPDAYVRAWAVRGLGDLGRARADEIVPALTRGTHLERTHAITAAGASHVHGAAAALRTIAAGDDATLAVEAIHALGKLPDAGAEPLLMRLRVGAGVRARAADLALARLKLDVDRFMTPAGDSAAGTSGWTILDQLGWVEALAAHPHPRARARLKALARLEATPDDRLGVRTAAAVAQVAEVATKADLPELRWHLQRPDQYVRASVVEPLAKLGGEPELPAIRAAFARAGGDAGEDFRLSAVHAVESIQTPAALDFLRSLKNDPCRNVRVAAAGALATRTGHTYPYDLGGNPTGRDPAHYRGVLARAATRPRARVTTTAGTFTIRLLPDIAPLTVESFLSLARRGYFDGLLVPRVVPEFVVQMGDPRGDLSGGPGYVLRCEVNANTYSRGTVGMALSGKDTGGSQFFVMHTRHAHLEGIYSIFGRVESGMDVVDRIAKGDRITSVRIEENAD